MKILHICLANFYLEGMGYQENILPYYHKKAAHEVIIFTSRHVFDESRGKNEYYNDSGILVKAVNQNKKHRILSKYRIYDGLYEMIETVSPDVIFVHGGQFLSLKNVISYVRKHRRVKLYIDQHADYYNTPVDTLKSKLAAALIFGVRIRKASKYAEKLWGVTPWRCQYLREVYGVPKSKIGLLTMGGDDEKIDFEHRDNIRKTLRKKLGLGEDDFVVISGGKIDQAKNIHLLMRAVNKMPKGTVKLLIFGQISLEMREQIGQLAHNPDISYLGWMPADAVYNYFLASDLAVFPGTHSVLWEQACACGLPALFKKWDGMQHVLVDGNCEFLVQDSETEIKEHIEALCADREKYNVMKLAAENCRSEFYYSKIAERSIQ